VVKRLPRRACLPHHQFWAVVDVKPQAAAGGHGAGDRQRWQARRCCILFPSPAGRSPRRWCRRPSSPPTDWDKFVQTHDNRDIFQASLHELPVIDIHSPW